MNNMFSKSAIWVVVALLLFMLFKQFDNHTAAGGSKTIAYSELLDDVKSRRLKDVVIEGQNITAIRPGMDGDSFFHTYAPRNNVEVAGVARSMTPKDAPQIEEPAPREKAPTPKESDPILDLLKGT